MNMDTSGSGFGGQYGPGGGDREEGRCFCGRPLDMVEVHVAPTTGGQFQLKVAASDNVEYLKRLISKRLRVPKERICLLYKDRHLREGTIVENNIVDGARLTLLPSVETGLLTQRPEQSVMQALESLNDGQVNDFLSGKAPLNLTMRLGDHMMLIQLQLSTVSPSSNGRRGSSRGSTISHVHDHHLSHQHSQYFRQSSNLSHCSGSSHSSCYGMYGSPRGCSSTSSLPTSPVKSPSSESITDSPTSPPATSFSSQPLPHHSYSSPSHHYHHHHHHHSHHHHHHSPTASPAPSSASPLSGRSSPVAASSNFSFDTDPLVRGCPHQNLDADPKAALDTRALAEASRNLTQTLKQLSSEVMTPKGRSVEKESYRAQTHERKRHSEKPIPIVSTTGSSQVCGINVNTSCPPATATPTVKASSKRQGAIIESMHHHGKGVYSGTFSGTLNPSLQDRQGRPKRDISTIIHILNDLLCATPQYRRTSSKASGSSLRNLNKAFASTFNQEDLLTSNILHRDKMDLDQAKDISRKETEDSQLTRTKLKQLRFIMEQTRAQRKARREARFMPYRSVSSNSSSTTTWSSETTTTLVTNNTDQTPQPMEVKNGEEADNTTLCELNSGTIVA